MTKVRDYTAEDREPCLAVFDSNVPEYFAAIERPAFESFLTGFPGFYLVLEENGEIVACGGGAPFQRITGEARLGWGMVIRHRLGTGLGRLLLIERLNRLKKDPSIRVVGVNTSQYAAGFFLRMGFEIRKITPNGWLQGIDKHEMALTLRS